MNKYRVTHYNLTRGRKEEVVEIVEAAAAVEALAVGCNKLILLACGYTWKGGPNDISNAHCQRPDGRVGSYSIQI